MNENTVLETKTVFNTVKEFLNPEPWVQNVQIAFNDDGNGYKIVITVTPGMKEHAESVLSEVNVFATIEVVEGH